MEIRKMDLAAPDVLTLFSEHDDFMLDFLGDDNWFYHRYSPEEHIDAVWVAYEGDAPLGCGAYREKDSGTGEVKRLFLRESARGRGLSKQLLHTVERYAQERGCRTLRLDTRCTLEPAVSLYRAAGYEIVFQQGLYIQMEKAL